MRSTAPFVTSAALLALVLGACGERTAPVPTATSGAPAPAPAAAPDAAAKPQHEMKKIAGSPDYPLQTCVISGHSLTEMGKPVAYSYDGTEVQFCCPDCVEEFQKEPEKYLAKVQAARK